MGADRLTSAFLRRVHRAAVRHNHMQRLLSKAMEGRYGQTHSDVDSDHLIDCLDLGVASPPTLAECDAEMTRAGAPPLSESPKP